MVFAARHPHGGIPDLDRDLVALMALFLAAALERAQYAERLQQLAFYDSLTGLPNRVLFDDRLKQTMSTAKRYSRGFSLMYLDLDNFKQINDRYGHPTGISCLGLWQTAWSAPCVKAIRSRASAAMSS